MSARDERVAELRSCRAAEAAVEITHLKELCRIPKPWLLAIDRKCGRVQGARQFGQFGDGFQNAQEVVVVVVVCSRWDLIAVGLLIVDSRMDGRLPQL